MFLGLSDLSYRERRAVRLSRRVKRHNFNVNMCHFLQLKGRPWKPSKVSQIRPPCSDSVLLLGRTILLFTGPDSGGNPPGLPPLRALIINLTLCIFNNTALFSCPYFSWWGKSTRSRQKVTQRARSETGIDEIHLSFYYIERRPDTPHPHIMACYHFHFSENKNAFSYLQIKLNTMWYIVI